MFEIIQDLKPGLKWYYGTKDKYNALKEKDPKGLYFITDTSELFRGSSSFGQPITFYDPGMRPLVGAEGRLYLNSKTLEGFSYNNGVWVETLDSISAYNDIDDGNELHIISGTKSQEMIDYVIAVMKAHAVSDVLYDEQKNIITYIKNSNPVPIQLPGMGTKLQFNLDTLHLEMMQNDGTILSSVYIGDNNVVGGKYDDERKAIIFNMRDGSEVRLKAYALLNLFSGGETSTMKNTVHNFVDGKNVLYSRVKLSAVEDSYISEVEDGIYARMPNDILHGIAADEMYVVKDGCVMRSKILITTLATEEYVEKAKQEVIQYLEKAGANWFRSCNVVDTISSTPDPNKVNTYNSLNKRCGLRRL